MDPKSILASYNPTEASFEIPTETTYEDEEYIEEVYETITIPSINPSNRNNSAPYKTIPYSQPVRITPTTRILKVTHLDLLPRLSSAGVRGMVTSVSHGTYNNTPASLIAFSFSLRSGDHGFRFKNANIKITFSKHSTSPLEEAPPSILKFAPRKIYGLPTTEDKKTTIGGEISLQVPAGPITIGPTINASKESSFSQDHRFSTTGNFWSSTQSSSWDIVYWNVRENKVTREGIPDRLNFAVVVEREGRFVAEVEVKVDTPVANGVFGHPWRRDRPAAFDPGVEMGKSTGSRRFEELGEREWRELVPVNGEWEDVFTDSAMGMGKQTQEERLFGGKEVGSLGSSRDSERLGVLGADVHVLEAEESDDR